MKIHTLDAIMQITSTGNINKRGRRAKYYNHVSQCVTFFIKQDFLSEYFYVHNIQ